MVTKRRWKRNCTLLSLFFFAKALSQQQLVMDKNEKFIKTIRLQFLDLSTSSNGMAFLYKWKTHCDELDFFFSTGMNTIIEKKERKIKWIEVELYLKWLWCDCSLFFAFGHFQVAHSNSIPEMLNKNIAFLFSVELKDIYESCVAHAFCYIFC